MSVGRGGEIGGFLAAVFLLACSAIKGDEITVDRGRDFLGLGLVQLGNILLHGGLVCRREISTDRVSRRPCAGGRAVLCSLNGQSVAVFGGHKHSFRRIAARSNREQVRRVGQDGAVHNGDGRTRRRQRARERSLRRVGLRRIHFYEFSH